MDLIVAGLTISAERESVVDFSYFYWEDKIGMLTGSLPGDPFYMFKPLHIYVWVGLVIAALVTAAGAAIYESSTKQIAATSNRRFMEPQQSIWYTLSAMWIQGRFGYFHSVFFHIFFEIVLYGNICFEIRFGPEQQQGCYRDEIVLVKWNHHRRDWTRLGFSRSHSWITNTFPGYSEVS